MARKGPTGAELNDWRAVVGRRQVRGPFTASSHHVQRSALALVSAIRARQVMRSEVQQGLSI